MKKSSEAVNFLGYSDNGELCELRIDKEHMAIVETRDGDYSSDWLDNAYWGNDGQHIREHSKIDLNETVSNPEAGTKTQHIAISNDIDKSSMELTITNGDHFLSGTLKAVRPGLYNTTCHLKRKIENSGAFNFVLELPIELNLSMERKPTENSAVSTAVSTNKNQVQQAGEFEKTPTAAAKAN